MKKPNALNKEIPFEFQELFFSTTDKRGVIKYGNDVFIRISGYGPETIIGAPHNIIRHPDMPRGVFKLFWDYLKEGKPVGAYVKNLSADGRYYWVFAFAFPVLDGYLSIRFKPSSSIFTRVQEIYAQVLEFEKEHTEEESEKLLMEVLKEEGFSRYDDFMVAAAVEELNAREAVLKDLPTEAKRITSSMQQISEVSQVTSEELDRSFAKIKTYQEGNHLFTNSVRLLEEEFNKLKFLSINMKVLAGNYGDQAATLGVVSEEFSKLAQKVEQQISNFSSFVVDLKEVVELCSLHLSALKIQMIMVDFFIKESVNKVSDSKDAFAGMLQNRDVFTNLFTTSVKQLDSELQHLTNRLNQTTQEIKEIQKLIIGLEVIKQTGAIESARKEEVKKSFDFYLSEMDSFMDLLRKTITKLNQEREKMAQATQEIHHSTNRVSGNIDHVFELALLNR